MIHTRFRSCLGIPKTPYLNSRLFPGFSIRLLSSPRALIHLPMEVLQTLSVALGLAALSGYSLYLTVFSTGLAIHYGWVHLAPQFESLSVLGDPAILIVSGVLFALEFFADKIPWVDTIWDAVHTVIRPVGGAFLATRALGHTSPVF